MYFSVCIEEDTNFYLDCHPTLPVFFIATHTAPSLWLWLVSITMLKRKVSESKALKARGCFRKLLITVMSSLSEE